MLISVKATAVTDALLVVQPVTRYRVLNRSVVKRPRQIGIVFVILVVGSSPVWERRPGYVLHRCGFGGFDHATT